LILTEHYLVVKVLRLVIDDTLSKNHELSMY